MEGRQRDLGTRLSGGVPQVCRGLLARRFPRIADSRPQHREFRAGDVLHSLADIAKARRLLGYEPTHRLADGLEEAVGWYVANLPPRPGRPA